MALRAVIRVVATVRAIFAHAGLAPPVSFGPALPAVCSDPAVLSLSSRNVTLTVP